MIFFPLISYPGLRASVHESLLPGMNSSRYLVLFLLLFTRFRPGKTSSWDDYFPVHRDEMQSRDKMSFKRSSRDEQVPYVNMFVRHGQDEFNSAGRLSSRDLM